MRDHASEARPRVFVGSSGCFEIEVTEDLIRGSREQTIRIALTQHQRRVNRTIRRLAKFRERFPVSAVRWVGLPGALASAFGVLLFYGEGDILGMAVWSGITLFFAMFWLAGPQISHWCDRWGSRLHLRIERGNASLIERRYRRAFEPLFSRAPYRVKYEFTDQAWVVRSSSGERRAQVSPHVVALCAEDTYSLFKSGFSSRQIIAAAVESPEQRALVEGFLQRHKIPLINADTVAAEISDFS